MFFKNHTIGGKTISPNLSLRAMGPAGPSALSGLGSEVGWGGTTRSVWLKGIPSVRQGGYRVLSAQVWRTPSARIRSEPAVFYSAISLLKGPV